MKACLCLLPQLLRPLCVCRRLRVSMTLQYAQSGPTLAPTLGPTGASGAEGPLCGIGAILRGHRLHSAALSAESPLSTAEPSLNPSAYFLPTKDKRKRRWHGGIATRHLIKHARTSWLACHAFSPPPARLRPHPPRPLPPPTPPPPSSSCLTADSCLPQSRPASRSPAASAARTWTRTCSPWAAGARSGSTGTAAAAWTASSGVRAWAAARATGH